MPPQENQEPKIPEPKPQTAKISPIRTFKSDVEGMVKAGVSSTAIVMAEQKKRVSQGLGTQEKAPLSPLYKIIIAASSLLLIAGVGLVSFYFIFPAQKNTAQNIFTVPKFINAEFEKEVPTAGLDKTKLLNILNKERDGSFIEASSILQNFFTKLNGTEKQNLSAPEFFTLLGFTPPASFVRSLQNNFMFGYHGFNGNQPFLIVRTESYDIAFAGMLDWEKRIPRELGTLFIAPKETPVIPLPPVATTTKNKAGKIVPIKIATTTVAITNPILSDSSFTDAVLRNKDARVLKDETGAITLLYSFVDAKTLVITTNENTLRTIVTRLEAAALVR